MNPLSFCFLETNLIFFSFLKDNFAWLTVSILNVSSPSLPSGQCQVHGKSLAHDGSFPLVAFNILSSSFDNLIVRCVSMDLFEFMLL